MKKLLILGMFLLCVSGCSTIASLTTPNEIKENVRASYVISHQAVLTPPVGEDLTGFLGMNEEAWQALMKFYGLEESK